jgi:hypothetical protein
MSSPGLSLARCVWATLSQATEALARTTGPPSPREKATSGSGRQSLARFDLARLLLLDASLLCASVGDNFSREFNARLTFYSNLAASISSFTPDVVSGGPASCIDTGYGLSPSAEYYLNIFA